MPLTYEPRVWIRDAGDGAGGSRYLCSTNQAYLQLDAINAAFASDMMWWAQPMPQEELERMVENSLCFGLYLTCPPDSTTKNQSPGKSSQTRKDPSAEGPRGLRLINSVSIFSLTGKGDGRVMIGFSRVITDNVTFGYLTDVYVLQEHQGKGLGKWMMECLSEVLDGMPGLRRFLLITASPGAASMYEKSLGARDFRKGQSGGMTLLERIGPAKIPPPLP